MTEVVGTDPGEGFDSTFAALSTENTTTALRDNDREFPETTATTSNTEHHNSSIAPHPSLSTRERYTRVYGLCSQSAKRDGTIVILQGCNVPVILREDENEPGFHTVSTYISCVCIAGYTQGEAIGKFKTQIYRIR
jgi:hypothetical protein